MPADQTMASTASPAKVDAALRRYRVLAYVVGTMLLLLVVFALLFMPQPLKFIIP